MQEIIENVFLDFSPCEVKIEESIDKNDKWLKIGGLALEEGVSENNRKYSFKNVKENDGGEFKWLFGHPKKPESHVIGKGMLMEKDGKLFHEGKIRNTKEHPDVVEQVIDGFLGPSIHAKASKIVKENDKFVIEGLKIYGIGMVAFQGVKNASIDYAITEQFEMKDKNEKVKNMENEIKTPVVEAVEPVKVETVTEMSNEVKEAIEELKQLKAERKNSIIEKILELNKEQKSEVLFEKNEESLKLILEYETKLAKSAIQETAVIETNVSEKNKKEEVIEEQDGSVRLSEDSWKEFNKSIMSKVI